MYARCLPCQAGGHYLGAVEDERMQNPTVVEVGFPPVRMTIPITSEARRQEAIAVGAWMGVAALAVLVLGGTYIEKVVKTWRGA